MRPASWTEAHDRLLADAEPPVPESSDAERERVWVRVAAAMEGESGPSRRRRRRIAVTGGIAAVVLGTSGLAAAQLYTAHTGQGPVDGEDLRLGGPGERLDPAAPDFGKVVAQETADIPFPSPEARNLAVLGQVRDARFAVPGDERVAVGAVRAWMADAALCSWSNQWALATRTGADVDRAEAIDMIQGAPRWPAVIAIDPAPYSRTETQEVTDGNGNVRPERFRDESQFFYLDELGKAVDRRSPDAVALILAENNGYCRSELVPDLPNADPLHPKR